MLDARIPFSLQQVIQEELESGERVVWSAMPKPLYFSGPALGAFLFAIPWTSFSVFWMAGAAGFKIPQFNQGFDFFPLFGLPFFFIGLGMLSSPLWVYRSSLNTAYAITDRRAITIEGGWSLTIRSYWPKDVQEIFRKVHRDGTGDVIFAHSAWRSSEGQQQTQELGFLRIENAKEVESMLRSLAVQAEPNQ